MSPSATVKTQNLKVPGATIHYEVCGSGPVLLMMPGGPADAGFPCASGSSPSYGALR